MTDLFERIRRGSQWVSDRFFGGRPGEEEPALVQLRWVRRCWLRMIWLVVVLTVAWFVVEGNALVLLLTFIDLVIFAMVINGLVRANWRIWREKRLLRRHGLDSSAAGRLGVLGAENDDAERAGRGWFQRTFRQFSNPEPDPDAPYLDVLLWVRRQYLRSLRIAVPGFILLFAVAVPIGALALFVFGVLFAVCLGIWVFTFAQVSWRIARARREPSERPSGRYPTTGGP
jgi:hypothetical protein